MENKTVHMVENQLTRILGMTVSSVIPDYKYNMASRAVDCSLILESNSYIIKADVYFNMLHDNAEEFRFHHKTDKIKYNEPHIHFSVLVSNPEKECEDFVDFYTRDDFNKIVGE